MFVVLSSDRGDRFCMLLLEGFHWRRDALHVISITLSKNITQKNQLPALLVAICESVMPRTRKKERQYLPS